MKFKLIIMVLVAAVLVGTLPFSGSVFAEDTEDTITTSYAFMGGSYNNTEKNYFIAGPKTYEFSGKDMWGFATIKFTGSHIAAKTVAKAYLNVELLGVGSMCYKAASEAYPAVVKTYSPGETDVATLTGETIETLKENLNNSTGGTSLLSTVTMTANGVWAIDITDIYNAWIAENNNGLVLRCASENSLAATGSIGAVGAIFTGATGVGKSDASLPDGTTAPYITVSATSTGSAPQVSSTIPVQPASGLADGIDVGTTIEITFDQSMDTSSVESAFSLVIMGTTDKLSGTFSWNTLKTEMTFTPGETLTLNTTYTVTVDTDAQSIFGKNLEQYEFDFISGEYIDPEPEVTGKDSLTGTVDVDTVSLTISGTGVYAYKYCLDGGEWTDEISLDQLLELSDLSDGTHTLEIQIKDGSKKWQTFSGGTYTWEVQVPPEVSSVSPENEGSAAVADSIEIVFDEAMDQDSVEAGFSISPEVDGTLSWEDKITLKFTPSMFFESETQYTVSIAASAADIAGNTLGETYTWTFTTLVANTVRCDLSEDTYVLFGGMGGGKGYPQGSSMDEYKLKCGAVYIVDARILMRFDLSPITDLGLTAEDIDAAYLIYTMLSNTDSMDVGPPAPDGTAMYGFMHVLSTDTREKTGETVDDFYWTEAVSEDGYVNMYNKPWFVPGAPYVTVTHTTGPYSTGKVDVAPIVKGWVAGRWENNGMELMDQDDQSYIDDSTVYGSEYGDGYSWHWASREDTDDGPYLVVTYDTDKLRIKDHYTSSEALLPDETRTLNASGGSGTYSWQITGPNGDDLSSSVLSATSGSSVTFTAPEQYGLCTVTLTSGDESDEINIGVGTVSGTDQAPLYLPETTSEEEKTRLTAICSDALEQMGDFGSFSQIALEQDGSQSQIGGTAQDGGSKLLIVDLGDPSSLTGEKEVSFETLDGTSISVVMTASSVSSSISQLYLVVVDTGNESPGEASGLFLFELYDENGDALSEDDISELEITIPYNSEVTGSDDPFSEGSWKIIHAPDLDTFYSGDEDADIEEVSTDEIESVNDVRHTVTFTTDHCSVYGAVTGVETEATEATPDESLGGGCFIGSLFW